MAEGLEMHRFDDERSNQPGQELSEFPPFMTQNASEFSAFNAAWQPGGTGKIRRRNFDDYYEATRELNAISFAIS